MVTASTAPLLWLPFSVSFSLHISFSVSLSVCLFVCLFLCLSVCFCFSVSFFLSESFSVSFSVCVCVCVCMCVCVCVCHRIEFVSNFYQLLTYLLPTSELKKVGDTDLPTSLQWGWGKRTAILYHCHRPE